jgi:hypothetical protein
MDHGSHRLHLMVVALLLCLLLPDLIPGGAAPAQFTQSNQGQQAEPAKPETPAPAAIPVAEVSIRAQEVARRLNVQASRSSSSWARGDWKILPPNGRGMRVV